MDGGNYPVADGGFSGAPFWDFYDGKVKFDTNVIDNANAYDGSASGFFPKSLLAMQKAPRWEPFGTECQAKT